MSGIDDSILLSVNRIRTTFRDLLGVEQRGAGTGFWVSLNQKKTSVPAFVTNRHNLDPEMLYPNQDYRLIRTEIQLRKQTADDAELHRETSWISIPAEGWVLHPTADCAAIIDPKLAGQQQGFLPFTAKVGIGNQYWLEHNVCVMDLASFIGFPGSEEVPWWDDYWTLPISRLATLASIPSMPFVNKFIKSGHVGLVSGLSFLGSSGSPLLLHAGHQGPVPLDRTISSYRHPQIIGIMSGHFREKTTEPEMFRHSGLSYYTRGPAIREVLGLDP